MTQPDWPTDRRPARRGRSRRRTHHPGSVRAQQDQQQPARRPRRRGGAGLPLPARRLRGRAAARPDPARPEPAEVRRPAAARADQVRPRSVPHPGRRAHHVVGRGGHPAQLQAARQRLRHQAGGPGPVHERGPADRRVLRSGGPAPAVLSAGLGGQSGRNFEDLIPLQAHLGAGGCRVEVARSVSA